MIDEAFRIIGATVVWAALVAAGLALFVTFGGWLAGERHPWKSGLAQQVIMRPLRPVSSKRGDRP